MAKVKRARTASSLAPPDAGKGQDALVHFDDSETQQYRPAQRQMQVQEEEIDIQAMEERERAIRQLEVRTCW